MNCSKGNPTCFIRLFHIFVSLFYFFAVQRQKCKPSQQMYINNYLELIQVCTQSPIISLQCWHHSSCRAGCKQHPHSVRHNSQDISILFFIAKASNTPVLCYTCIWQSCLVVQPQNWKVHFFILHILTQIVDPSRNCSPTLIFGSNCLSTFSVN